MEILFRFLFFKKPSFRKLLIFSKEEIENNTSMGKKLLPKIEKVNNKYVKI